MTTSNSENMKCFIDLARTGVYRYIELNVPNKFMSVILHSIEICVTRYL